MKQKVKVTITRLTDKERRAIRLEEARRKSFEKGQKDGIEKGKMIGYTEALRDFRRAIDELDEQ